ncbi:MAG: 5-oxoprolinase subunit PxpB [Chlorobi bacterium]|nr:5-oxoprolinase subunit PxpB [Chlorobiota bacterium]
MNETRKPDILPFGDHALLINFSQEIDPEINRSVHILARELKEQRKLGITSIVPAYCSITVEYDINLTSFTELSREILGLFDKNNSQNSVKEGLRWKIPVCYDSRFGLDLKAVAKYTGLNEKEIIALHTSMDFQVFMLGFLPGFAYLGKLPAKLQCPRKENPRLKVAKGSVGIAGFQTGIYTLDAPGGWQILGKTPVLPFDPERKNPFLFSPGDNVRFHPVPVSVFKKIEMSVHIGNFKTTSLHG